MESYGKKDIVLVGGGSHARVVRSSIRLEDWNVLGYVDRSPVWDEMTWLGTDEWLFDKKLSSIICCVGRPKQRLIPTIVSRYKGHDPIWVNIRDASALVKDSVVMGKGIYVAPKAFINIEAEIGDHTIINSGAIVEHNCKIGSCVFIAPGVVLGGGVKIGDNTFIGLGAHIRDHVTLGHDVTIGMGSVVLRDVLPGETVLGIQS